MGLMKISKSLVRTLFAVPPTSGYPRGGLKLPDASRGGVGIDEEKCTLCELCMRRCPSGAVVTDRRQERVLIDRMRCIACGECVEECPFGALEMLGEYVSPETSVLIDVYRVKASSDSRAVLDGVEFPPDEMDFPETLRKSMLRTREVQSIRRKKAAMEDEPARKTRARYRNKIHGKGIDKKS